MLNFCQCINLLSKLIKKGILQEDPNNENNILVYRTAGCDNPEGWYSQNILDAATELSMDEEGQKFLLSQIKTQSDYFEEIKEHFVKYIVHKEDVFRSYKYSDKRAVDLLKQFRSAVESGGMKYSEVYHANGIGNNNKYTIYVEEVDNDGFVIRKNIAEIYYCYGVYGGCCVALLTFQQKQVGLSDVSFNNKHSK